MKNIFGLVEAHPSTNLDLKIIAAGPLTKQPATLPYRHVLTLLADDRFTVHCQYFDNGDRPFVAATDESWLSGGHYFPAGSEGFVKAQQKFAECIAAHAGNHATCFREESATPSEPTNIVSV